MMRRAVVTGLGVLAPNGIGLKEFRDGLWEGRNAIGPITAFDAAGFASRIAGQIPECPLPGRSMDDPDGDARVVRLALAAAHEAAAQAGLSDSAIDLARVGVTVSNAIGGTEY